jgi:hypothetical protein
MKAVASAESWVQHLPDGRVQYGIKHDLIRGVTPKMIVWYLNHMTDGVEYGGATIQRYRLWHPRDHILLEYLKPAANGDSFGAGAQVHIREAFQADPSYKMSIKANVEFLDETGFAHFETMAGLKVARVDYTFEETPEGTRYQDVLTVGLAENSALSRLFNRTVAPLVFPEEKGLAWIQHNIEEVGNFEFFLPEMYERDSGD